MARTGKINGNIVEAFQNVKSGPQIQFGLLKIVNADISGVVGICRGYVTGAQIKGSEHVGLRALQEICRSKRGMWTIHEKCDPGEFVAVNQELHLPINDVIQEIERTGGDRIFRLREAEFGVEPPQDEIAAEVAAVQVNVPAEPFASQAPYNDPQTDTGRQRAVPPLGGLAVPPPPGGMFDKVKEIANAMSGKFRAVGAPPKDETQVSAKRRAITPEEEDELCYDPTAITKGGGILNQVLSHAKNTFTRMTSLKAREQQMREQEQQQQQPQQWGDPPMVQQTQHPEPAPPAPPVGAQQLAKQQSWWPQSQQNPQSQSNPNMSSASQPQPPARPQKEEEGSFNIAPPQDPRRTAFGNSYQFDQSALQGPVPPQPPRIQPPQNQEAEPYQHPLQQSRMQQIQQQQYQQPEQYEQRAHAAQTEKQEPKEKLSQSTIVQANELYQQEIRNKAAGRTREHQKLRNTSAAYNDEDESNGLEEEDKQPASSAWSKLFFWKKD